MKRLFFILTSLIFLVVGQSQAHRLRFDSLERGQMEYGFSAGYSENHKFPSSTRDRVAFDVAKFRVGRFASSTTEYGAELCFGEEVKGTENQGLTLAGTVRHYFCRRGSTAIAWDFSIGLMRCRQPITSQQSTRINFNEQIGLALQYGMGPESALTVEYKFSHTSNAGLRLPNLGVNASIVSLGYSWYR